MPTRKIDSANWPTPCQHPEHKPPTMTALPPGTYEHECPKCHGKQFFVVIAERF